MKKIIILGSTGSIGRQAADVVRRFPDKFSVEGLSSNSNISLLKSQILEFRPAIACVGFDKAAIGLKKWAKAKKLKTKIVCGSDGLQETAQYGRSEIVLAAVVGSAGLAPLIAAIRSGKNIALANKEALVIAGDIVTAEARKKKVSIIPVDSEHSAIFQCLKNEKPQDIRKIILTASGGPFYRSDKNISDITVSDALAHPTWDMGPKITIDSATLMNKGLEAIEAHFLFAQPLDKIEIVIHPQSIVHSMVEFADSSVIAQMSLPDMRLPIQYALTYPERFASALKPLDFARIERLEFAKPDFRRFPCLSLALAAGREGGSMPAVMNAANETAVNAFLHRKISFADIAKIIERVMAAHQKLSRPSLNDIFASDMEAKIKANEEVNKK